MAKDKPTLMQNIRENPLAYTVQIVGILIVVLNLWIVTKLAPITQDLAVITTRVEAVEKDFNVCVTTDLFETVERRLIRIENKIDGL